MSAPAARRNTAIVWFRDDLRVADNPALDAAARTGMPVVGLYVHDTVSPGVRAPGAAQKWMLHHALAALREALAELGVPLVLRAGPAEDTVREVAGEAQAGAIFWNRRYDQALSAIDSALRHELTAAGVKAASFNGNYLHEPSLLKTGAGGPYKVFTPFRRALAAGGEPTRPLPPPSQCVPGDAGLPGLGLDELSLLPGGPDWTAGLRASWPAGEAAAMRRFRDFLEAGLQGYGEGRDRPGKPHVSRMSPYLRFGVVSPRQLWHGARESDAPAADVEKFLGELAWREFCCHLAFHFPDMASRNFDARFDAFPWSRSHRHLPAWKKGLTGYPIVDAGMRELWRTGFMHNRVRMIVASFLVKDLMIDWRIGESWFWDTLVDGDRASNPANWQWVAGSGADAAPYFRIFNPVLQGEKFDPDGDYVRSFVPELAALPGRILHKPWEADARTLAQAGVELGVTYPHRVVDHRQARQCALDALQSVKKAS